LELGGAASDLRGRDADSIVAQGACIVIGLRYPRPGSARSGLDAVKKGSFLAPGEVQGGVAGRWRWCSPKRRSRHSNSRTPLTKQPDS